MSVLVTISPHNFSWHERLDQDVDQLSQRLRIDRVQINKYSYAITAVPLTARDMDRAHLAMTITRMDAGVEPPWMVSRRVIGRCARFMSRLRLMLVLSAASTFVNNDN